MAATLTSTVKITKTVTVTAAPPPFAPKTVMETDGMYRVGIDIVPGTYRSGGKSDDGLDCFWARLNSLNENDIISGNTSSSTQLVTSRQATGPSIRMTARLG